MTQGTKHLDPDAYATEGKVDPARLDALLAEGVSIIVSGLETRLRGLIALAGEVRVKLGDRMAAYAIVSTGAGGALMQHYDCEDILVLQLEGSKRWQVHTATIANPVKGQALALPPTDAPVFDDTIEQGDILFVPAGHWHRCENGEGRSLHLAIGFEPFTGWDAITRLIEQLQFDADFRAPLSRNETQADRDALEAKLKARLTAEIGKLSLRDFLARS
jgi:ribosomal protein L16 Arg81 hydroxylase